MSIFILFRARFSHLMHWGIWNNPWGFVGTRNTTQRVTGAPKFETYKSENKDTFRLSTTFITLLTPPVGSHAGHYRHPWMPKTPNLLGVSWKTACSFRGYGNRHFYYHFDCRPGPRQPSSSLTSPALPLATSTNQLHTFNSCKKPV